MPREWDVRHETAPERSGAFSHAEGAPPAAVLRCWPHRSLPRRGFVAFIAITCTIIAALLLMLLGSPVVWGLLPFFAAAVAGVWFALRRNERDLEILEECRIWPDRITLVRHEPRRPPQNWEANPHWVRVTLQEHGGPVENYVTLKGGGRDVEIGAFLTPDERKQLYRELGDALSRLARIA